MGLNEKLGRRVADLRQAAGMTQADLAERVSVATETISRLERGAVVPSLARLEQIAGALGVEFAELFRFQARATKKDVLVERLLAAVRRRSAEDVEVVLDVTLRILERLR